VTSFGTTYIELGCLMPSLSASGVFFTETIMFALLPFIFLTLTALIIAALKRKGKLFQDHDLLGDILQTALVVIFFFMQPSLTSAAVEIFQCVQLGDVCIRDNWI
jgi:hypothetical protein